MSQLTGYFSQLNVIVKYNGTICTHKHCMSNINAQAMVEI